MIIRGGSYFPYLLLNEIQTMFSPLAMGSSRVLPGDLFTDHVHYIKKPKANSFEEEQKYGNQRRDCFSPSYFIICKFIDFVPLLRHSVWFAFSCKQLSSTYESWKQCRWIMRTFTCKHKIWGKNWLYLRPYLKAFPVFNVFETWAYIYWRLILGLSNL